jgi:cation diffusion facilitator CzcD-associated flavoprotein CzcO
VNDEVLIVGTGFAGIGTAIRLMQAGITRFTLLERADEVGGTWRDNHYPGAACDVESHLYSFSFEPNPEWTRTFARQAEILEYLKRCAKKYGVYPHIRFRAGVASARWDEAAALWHVRLDDGATLTARVLVSACGGLSRPGRPDIAGLERFEGKSFHSARWDHSFGLEGKDVAVIGTGASAVQIVPAIAPQVRRLFVYQRTPPWTLPKADVPIPPSRRALYRRFPALQRLRRRIIFLQREALGLGFVRQPRLMWAASIAARQHLRQSVASRELRAKLEPSYKMGCKRILPTNDFYPALERPNVELVTDGIETVTARGIRTNDGVERSLDAIVLATGFEAAEHCAPFEILGRGGRSLAATWEPGAEAYLGTSVSGFPNLFLVFGPNTALGHSSMILIIEAQIAYIRDAITTMRHDALVAVDVLPAVQARYNEEIQARLARSVWASGCKSWYLTRSGKNTTLWPGLIAEFRRRTERFDASRYDLTPQRSLAGRELSSAPAAP